MSPVVAKPRFFGAPIQLRVIYALIASLLWFAMVGIADSLAGGYGQYLNWATGAVFAALVLLPYLPRLEGAYRLRALGLLLCGVLSYWSSITLFVWLGHPGIQRAAVPMGLAGVGGALIIGIGARLFVPLALRRRGWLMLMGAGLLGGIILGISFPASIGTAGTIDHKYWLPGHIAWQLLVCLALYYGSDRITPPRARP